MKRKKLLNLGPASLCEQPGPWRDKDDQQLTCKKPKDHRGPCAASRAMDWHTVASLRELEAL